MKVKLNYFKSWHNSSFLIVLSQQLMGHTIKKKKSCLKFQVHLLMKHVVSKENYYFFVLFLSFCGVRNFKTRSFKFKSLNYLQKNTLKTSFKCIFILLILFYIWISWLVNMTLLFSPILFVIHVETIYKIMLLI